MERGELWNKKWKIFARRARIFRHMPFVEFVLLSGSMATGRVREGSDFDLVIGVRVERVWTTWFVSSLILQFRGWREHPSADSKDRLSLQHFASPKGYKSNPPYDDYWQEMFGGMMAVYGDGEKVNQFFKANDWMVPERRFEEGEHYLGNDRSLFSRCLEFVLGGGFGNAVEALFERILTRKIENSLPYKKGKIPRYVFNHDKLEFYPREVYIDPKKG